MTDNIPAVPLSPSGRRLNIPLANPAREEGDVFIPLNKTVEALEALLARAKDEGEKVVFIRAPVASGKTTLANYLGKKHSDKFVYVDFATSENQWYQHVVDASDVENLNFLQVRIALKSIAQQDKIIVIDEAHLIFGYPGVVSTFFKCADANSAPMFLLFSASGSSEDNEGKSIVTPQEIRRKYMWYPPIPNGEKLRSDLMEAKKPVVLDTDSINFIVALCGGHRGIIMNAMKWIQEQQQNTPSADESLRDSKKATSWTIADTVAQVRRSLEQSDLQEGGQRWNKGLRKFLKDCRAVCVSGKYSNLRNIPKEFGLVLYEGPKKMGELNNQERKLTINGFLFPERRRGASEEFIQYDWNDSEVMYCVPNPVMAEYYGDVLPKHVQYKRRLLKETKKPNCAADLMARVLPFLTFSNVVANPISRQDGSLSNCLSKKGMPYEDDYNGAIAHILKNVLCYHVSTPLDRSFGKTDVVVSYEDGTTCAIESILAAQSPRAHVEHAERFLNENKTNYYDAAQKLLLIIGGSGTREEVKDRIQHVSTALEGRQCALEIVGIYVSLNHDIYEMYREGDPEPFYFDCDRVPKTLQRDNDGRLKAAQVCIFESDDEAAVAKKLKSSR